MFFDDAHLDKLKEAVRGLLSPKRFAHTEGVERLAIELGRKIIPEYVTELRAAALLHDIAKELPSEALLSIMKRDGVNYTLEDFDSEPVYHAFAAPTIIKRDFPDFATNNVLSAVFKHTTGDPDMSLFDEIIFIADFAEAGRTYESCRSVAKALNARMRLAIVREEAISALHLTMIDTLDAVISTLKRLGIKINPRTILTRNCFLAKI